LSPKKSQHLAFQFFYPFMQLSGPPSLLFGAADGFFGPLEYRRVVHGAFEVGCRYDSGGGHFGSLCRDDLVF
jgi:hypothetical protein